MENARRIAESIATEPRRDHRHEVQKKRGVTNDRELWCEDIDWLLNEGPSYMGQHGTFGGFLSIMETGGPGSISMGPIAPPDDEVLGTGPRHLAGIDESKVAHFRRLDLRWARMARESRAIHSARYQTLNAAEICKPGVEGALGDLKGVVAMAHSGNQLARIIEACQHVHEDAWTSLRARTRITNPDRLVVVNALRVAEVLVRSAHRNWWALAS